MTARSNCVIVVGSIARSIVIDLTVEDEGSEAGHVEGSTLLYNSRNESCADPDQAADNPGVSTNRKLAADLSTSGVPSCRSDGMSTIKVETAVDIGQVELTVPDSIGGTALEDFTADVDPAQPDAIAIAAVSSTSETTTEDHAGNVSSLVKHEVAEEPQAIEKQQTALERAGIMVVWDAESIIPSLIDLGRCRNHQDLFAQLEHLRPPEIDGRKIKNAEIVLTNAVEAGISESPNCRLLQDDGEAAFDHLTEVLKGYTPEIRPELRLVVQYW